MNSNVPVETYVFLDLETTGLPSKNFSNTKITEISLISALRKHFDENPSEAVPRVLNKLTMCFHPCKFITGSAQTISGLNNELLEEQSTFNVEFCDLLHSFLLRHPEPICLLAHNGNNFDFPLIQSHSKFLKRPLPDDILCADTLHAFRELKIVERPPPRHIPLDVMEPYTLHNFEFGTNCWPPETDDIGPDVIKFLDDIEHSLYEQYKGLETDAVMSSLYKGTPTRRASVGNPPKINRKSPPLHESMTSERIRRRLDFDKKSPRPCKPSYRLQAVYQHLFGKPPENSHTAEGDCLALLKCIAAIGTPFHDWVLSNHKPLNQILKLW
ncbi:three-prime repair exonuclease 1 [Cimex lectularius]|uniref:Exonuclease domain-containing protein n=1 Tax=Cimex lectularius TaxID=79782 RepID=A0A8I6TDA3_CIMLE|nr:three-prime repair exonuclease 1 [Cimex lectularius]